VETQEAVEVEMRKAVMAEKQKVEKRTQVQRLAILKVMVITI
jgi:hypothetical protein